jgi:archaellum component FlaC
MSTNSKAIEAIKEEMKHIDNEIETKSNELKELKQARKRLASSLEILEALNETISNILS